MTMTASLRKLALTAHVTTSVGWLGALKGKRGQIRSWLFRVASGKGRFRKRRGKEDADLF